MTVNINEQTATYDIAIGELLSSAGCSISPSSASPVLKTFVTITLDPANTFDLVREDLTVTVVPNDPVANPNGVTKDLYVAEVDNSARTITAKFGGAWSGVYDIIVHDQTVGRVNMDGVQLTAIGTVTDFTPK